MIKWIGQHIISLIARFRDDVYLENLEESTQDHVVGIDSDGKLYKQDKATKTSIGLGSVDNLSEAELTTNILATADKTDVGLDNVDNTSDANKPISTATQAALDAKAPTASPTFTGTVSGVTAAHVGLGSVDNTSDLNKPPSTATLALLANKAPIASPTFTGTVSGITASMVGLSNVEDKSSATIRGEIVSADIPNNAADTSGNAATATALATARNIAGVAFDGTGDISLNNNAITNGAGYTTNTGDITQVGISVAGTGLIHSVTSDDATIFFGAGEGIDISLNSLVNNQQIMLTIDCEDASDSNKGIASFSSDNFVLSSGDVRIKSGGIDLTDEVTGILPVANGGTGLNSISTLLNSNVTDISGNAATATALTSGDKTISGDLTVTSGTSGDATLIISADTDNNDGNDLPRLWFKADGDITEGAIQLQNNTLDIINNVGAVGGIRFLTGTTNNTGTADPQGGATERMSISSAGVVDITNSLSMNGTSTLNSSGVLQVAAQPNITSLGTLTGLDVASSVTADTFVSIQGVDTGNPNAATDELRVSGYGILGNRASGVYITNESSSGKLFFGVGDKHALATRMTILANGNVGINTTSPGSHLHVNGNIRVNGSSDSIQSNNWAPIANANSEIRSNNGYDLILNATTGDNVGIATSSPGERLDVSGNIKLSGHIELGHASDTTIARSAAGKATIEGREITTNGSSGTNFITFSTNGYVDSPSVGKLYMGHSLYGNYHFNWASVEIGADLDTTTRQISKNAVNCGWPVPVDLAKVEVRVNCRPNASGADLKAVLFKTASELSGNTDATVLGTAATVTGANANQFNDLTITDGGAVTAGEVLYVAIGSTNATPQLRFSITILGYVA